MFRTPGRHFTCSKSKATPGNSQDTTTLVQVQLERLLWIKSVMPFPVEKKGRSKNPTYSPVLFGVGAKEGAEGEKTQT